MIIPRVAADSVRHLAADYPVVALTGPRQSGKTTLVRHLFSDKPYVSLEDLDERAFATEDPRGFLSRFPFGAVLDEVQRVPSIFSYLQTRVDKTGVAGQFILTGSQQFDFISGITQSLAGRVALATLLPFSIGELQRVGLVPDQLDQIMFAGLYPPVYDRELDPRLWYANYTRTYVERDVRQLINVRDLQTFQRFVKLCAGRNAQLLNLSALAADCGITHPTARAWMSVLEASYIIYLLQPHHRNFNKRLIKTPKLYFYDTGLVCHLLGIDDAEQLATHSQRGALFESLVVAELLKARVHRLRRNNLFFWRDRAGTEVDVLIESGEELVPVEIKSGQTIASDFDKGLRRWQEVAHHLEEGWLVYGGKESVVRKGTQYVAWRDVPSSPLAE
jgi:uncharacterized protein